MLSLDITLILLQRLWQAAAGLVTMLFIAHFLTPIQQGWYYSFLSLASLYTLFDLGLSVVLMQISSHLFVGMKWLPGGSTEGGDPHPLWVLIGRSIRLYLLLALFFSLILVPAGWLFFWAKSGVTALPFGDWLAPWVMLIFVTALSLLVMPYFSLIEGSGQVREIYAIRLAQGVLGSLTCWFVLAAGGGLWATVMAPGMSMAVAMFWLLKTKPTLLQTSLRISGRELAWQREVWPLQWRIGLRWICGYLLTQIFTPILFSAQGAVEAGQMGLSLTIANTLGLLAHSWIAQRVPAMARSAAMRDWESLDRLFNRNFLMSLVAFLGGAIILCTIHTLLRTTPYSGRLLSFWPFIGLFGVTFIGHINGALASHLRSFRREAFVWVSVVGATITVPAAIWVAGNYGAGGVVLVMFSVQFLLILPLTLILWQKYNRDWRLTDQAKFF